MAQRDLLRVALTQTANIYNHMPANPKDLESLRLRLSDIRQANLEHHKDLIQAAKTHDVQIMCFGEIFSWPYFPSSEAQFWFEAAEDAFSGPTITFMKELAASHEMTLIVPIYELDKRINRRFSTAVLIDHLGKVVGLYRKCHVPHGNNELGDFFERYYFEVGNEFSVYNSQNNISTSPFFPVFTTRHANIGIMMCYDRHFEGVVATLASQGADLIFCPSATFGKQSRRVWEIEFAVDAVRHNVFVAGANRLGREVPWNIDFFGDSHIVGPNGRIENLSPYTNLAIFDIDFNQLNIPNRAGWNLIRDRRTDIFGENSSIQKNEHT